MCYSCDLVFVHGKHIKEEDFILQGLDPRIQYLLITMMNDVADLVKDLAEARGHAVIQSPEDMAADYYHQTVTDLVERWNNFLDDPPADYMEETFH